jgi:hypothetical protein
MRVSKPTLALVVCAVIAAKLVGCSAGSSDAGLNGPNGNGGGNGAGAIFGGGTGSTGNQNAGGDFIPMLTGSGASPNGGAGPGSDAGACGIKQKPEEILQYSPVGLFIMQDRSGSMVTGFPPPASPDGWKNSQAAVTAFVNDPSSNGLSVGLGSFPPMNGNTDCSGGTDCGTPIVPIAPLPGNANPMISGMQSATPNNPIALTPTECGLRGLVSECTTYTATSKIQCVGVLVTDGTPTQCDTDPNNLAKILSDAAARGIKTFVIGLPGSNLSALDALAAAGGTSKAIDVSGGATAFIAGLNAIRGKVSVGTALPCTWKIPPPTNGQVFDPAKVNVSFTPKGGTAQDFGFVAQADCARASNAWYFDDPNKPTQVLACPTTCDTLKASSGAEVDVSFGCARKPAVLH